MRELQVYPNAPRNRWRLLAGAVLLLLMNAFVAWRFFSLEYASHVGSVEGAYVALTSYFAHHGYPIFGYSLSWFPLWYGGEPVHNTYPPGLMWICAAVVRLTGWTAAHSYHFITAIEYSLGPVTAFLLAASLSGRTVASFAGGVLYSLVNVSLILTREARADAGGRWLSRRLQVLEVYGEGPHILTLVLLPLAILLVHRALRRRRPLDYSLAAFGLAAVLLSNVMGALAILLGVYAYLVTRDELHIWDCVSAAALGAIATAMAAMFIPPSMAAVIRERAVLIGGDFHTAYAIAPVFFPLLFIAAAVLSYLMRRFNADSATAFFAVAFFLFAAIALPAYWFGVSFTPMPKRYHVEFDLFLPFAIALALARVPRRYFTRPLLYTAATLAALAVVLQLTHLKHQANALARPLNVAKSSEFKIAKQLASYGLQGRVLVPGSAETWLDAFAELPEIGGGFVQAIPNHNNLVALYLIQSNDGGSPNPSDSVLWLQAFGVARVATTGPGSTEFYKPFQNPDKFQGLLKEIWRDGGDAIYQVPLHSEGLVHVVPRGALVVATPVNGLDVKEVSRYVAALSKEPVEPGVTWETPSRARIRAQLKPNDAISVQVSYVQGWKAIDASQRIPVEADGIGQIKILPNRTGPVDILLEYDGGLEAAVTKAISFTAILGTLLLGAGFELARRRKRQLIPAG